MWWIYPVYLVDLVVMVGLSFFLGDLVDKLDKKTKISGAFIGGVLLAAVTSLPELFTALPSIFLVNEPEYVVGDLLGSIVFDMVCLLLETLIFVKNFRNAKLQKFHLVNAGGCLLMGALSLGIGTSIPEIVSTAQLFKKKNYDAGFGNMIGSCTFDFAIFALSDFLTWHQYNNHVDSNGEFIISQRGLYIANADSIQFEIFGAIVCVLTIALMLFKIFSKAFEKKKALCYTVTSVIAIASLALYLLIYII